MSSEQNSPHRPRIVVIDDDDSILRLMGKMLQHEGYDVYLTTDGAKGVANIQKMGADVVILDLNMPRTSGFEVLEALKASSSTAHIPIIVTTATYQSVDNADYGLSIGASEYMVKPVMRAALLHAVKRNLKPVDTGLDDFDEPTLEVVQQLTSSMSSSEAHC